MPSSSRVSALLVLAAGCGHHAPSDEGDAGTGLPSENDSAHATASALASESPPEPGQPFLQYEIRDAATGELMGGKLTFVGVAGTKDPQFSTNDLPREDAHSIAAYARVMSITGDGRVAVPKGTYDVFVSRGPEWSLDVHKGVEVGPTGAVVQAKLTHEIKTPGWISGDFHVHASSSFDSRVPMSARICEFVSDGVDLIVSTDHNVISDYGPVIQKLGATDLITTIRGDEITTRDWGHYGAFPLPLDESRKDGGAPPTKSRTAKQIFAEVRKREPDAIIDVHHPRFDRGLGYFTTGIFDTKTAKAGRPGFSFDFDALEILNGYQDADHLHVDEVLSDWFSLLNHGYPITATGNSDTHHLNYNLGGYPRNYVKVEHDEPASADPKEIVAAIRAHHAFFTTGPFVELSVGAAGIGDVAKVDAGDVEAHVVVRAASWIATDKVTVYVGGKIAATRTLGTGRDPVRLDEKIKVAISRDTFIVVRVDAAEPLPCVVGDAEKKFQALPFAVTNPVFLDVDKNGRFDPPKKP